MSAGHVTVVPEHNRISVLSSGNAKGSMTSMPLSGHCAGCAALAMTCAVPSTISIGAGNKAAPKNAQNQATKNITSDAMKRIMP